MGIIVAIKTSFKSLVIMSTLPFIFGYGDELWHRVFGLDGAISPPHLALSLSFIFTSWFILKKFWLLRSKFGIILGISSLWISITLLLIILSSPTGKNMDLPTKEMSFIVSAGLMPMLSILVNKAAHRMGIRSLSVGVVFAAVTVMPAMVADPYTFFLLPLFLASVLASSAVFDLNHTIGAIMFGTLWILVYSPYAFPTIAYAISGQIFTLRDTATAAILLIPYYPIVSLIGLASSLSTYYLLVKHGKVKQWIIKLSSVR